MDYALDGGDVSSVREIERGERSRDTRHGQDHLTSPTREVATCFYFECGFDLEMTAEKREKYVGRVIDLWCGCGIGTTA